MSSDKQLEKELQRALKDQVPLHERIVALVRVDEESRQELKELKKAQRPLEMWERPLIFWSIVLALTLSDFFTLSLSISKADLTGDSRLLYFISFITALVINFVPILMARIIREHVREGKENVSLGVSLFVMVSVSLSLVVAVFMLRVVQTSTVTTGNSTNLLNVLKDFFIIEPTASGTSSKYSDKNVLTLLLSFLPICTSVVNFFLAWINADPLKTKCKQLESKRLSYMERIAGYEATIKQCEEYIFGQQLQEADSEQYKEKIRLVESMAEVYKQQVRARLNEHLGKPVAATILADDA